MAPHPKSVQWWLGALVLGVATPALALVVLLCVQEVRREDRQARDAALHIARVTSKRLRSMRRESTELLERMSTRPGVAALDPVACHAELAAVDFLSRYAELYLFDASGRLVCSGNTDPENAAMSALARPWIEGELRAGRLQPRVGLLRTFGEQEMMVTAASTSTRGGTIVLLEFADFLGRAAVMPRAVIMIVGRDGTVIARSGRMSEWAGRNITGSPLARIRPDVNEGIVAATGLDGISRQYAYVRVPELEWTVYGGVPSWTLLEPVRETVFTSMIGLAIVGVLIGIVTLALARRIGRPMRALAAAAEAAGEGFYTRVHPAAAPREVTALADAFNEMIERREKADGRLKSLSERLLTVQEEERARIARELHDDLGQSLTALKMDVVGLLQASQSPPALAPIRDRILRTLDATVTSVQRISSELRPSVLDDLGLVAAIEAEARVFEERSGIECEVSVAGEIPADRDCITAVYRIVQEALTNVARHSNATRTELRLRNRGDELLLEIRDDGRGATAEEIGDPMSFGLIGIRERAAVIGGMVQIEGVAGRGTIVSVRIPLAAKVRLA